MSLLLRVLWKEAFGYGCPQPENTENIGHLNDWLLLDKEDENDQSSAPSSPKEEN